MEETEERWRWRTGDESCQSFSSASSAASSFRSSFDLDEDRPPMSEYEEIPSRRWLSPSFWGSPLPSRREAKTRPVAVDDACESGLAPDYRSSFSRAVPEVSSILGGARIAGLEVPDVLDTFGDRMTNLKFRSGFLSGRVQQRNKTRPISILAFEVANTIAQGATLMQSLSEENIQFLRKHVLQSDVVRELVSADTQELLTIVAADKREEFDVFSKEVARFGNLCKDQQWHNLDRHFQNIGKFRLDSILRPNSNLRKKQRQMQHLANLAQLTYELYHEVHALDRFELDYQQKLQEEESLPTIQQGQSNLMVMRRDLKRQRKLVRSLKKKSLWSRNFEEVTEILVDSVFFLHEKILVAFGHAGMDVINSIPDHGPQRLGVLGLALHYANVIKQIDDIVSQQASLPSTRDTLYHGLPAKVKASLHSHLQDIHAKKELSVSLIKNKMQKILQWLVPMAENTIRAHLHSGWVGEWANMSTELNNTPSRRYDIIRIQTLHHADKLNTEECILQLAVWLCHSGIHVKQCTL